MVSTISQNSWSTELYHEVGHPTYKGVLISSITAGYIVLTDVYV